MFKNKFNLTFLLALLVSFFVIVPMSYALDWPVYGCDGNVCGETIKQDMGFRSYYTTTITSDKHETGNVYIGFIDGNNVVYITDGTVPGHSVYGYPYSSYPFAWPMDGEYLYIHWKTSILEDVPPGDFVGHLDAVSGKYTFVMD